MSIRHGIAICKHKPSLPPPPKNQTGPPGSPNLWWIFLEGQSASVSVFAEMIVSGRRVLGY